MILLETTSAVQTLCKDVQHHIHSDPDAFITIDTEFVREKTYWPLLSLVQIGLPEHVYLIDALTPGIDLSDLYVLLQNPAMRKVFHASRQDMEIFYHLTDVMPQNIFDTQIMASLAGLGENIGYEALVKLLLNHQLDKTEQYSQWARRPLSQAQLHYAAADVTHLRAVYRALIQRLKELNRWDWAEEEMLTLYNPKLYKVDPAEAWAKLDLKRVPAKYYGVAQALAELREQLAQAWDVPKNRVIKDQSLYPLMITSASTLTHLKKSAVWEESFDVIADDIWRAIEKGRAQSLNSPHTVLQKSKSSDILDLLKLVIKSVAYDQNLGTSLLATTDDLRTFIQGDPLCRLKHGWRHSLVGTQLDAVIAGHQGVYIEGQNLCLKKP